MDDEQEWWEREPIVLLDWADEQREGNNQVCGSKE